MYPPLALPSLIVPPLEKSMTQQPWTTADNLTVVGLAGTRGHDRDRQDLLEIAVVPLNGGRPDMSRAWETTINPGRCIAAAPGIAPQLTGSILLTAPALADIADDITSRLHKRILIGHNLTAGWPLLHRHLPELQATALIDTARLYKHLHPAVQRLSLSRLVDLYGLAHRVDALAPKRVPYRAMWGATTAALLLPALIAELPDAAHTTLAELESIASLPGN
ncbi:3'-5' exonuclease [Nonomuraea typhae]|uniref:3'-5' exonuclease n=1 Tax=Nonomuraea typhae TaxID=2603600 RepID=A0ABW7YMR8_9ACTN